MLRRKGLLITDRPATLISLHVLTLSLKMSSGSIFDMVTEIIVQETSPPTCIIHLCSSVCSWQLLINFNIGGDGNSLLP